MVKRRNTRRKRQNHSATRSSLARIATGVPVSRRNVPRDPPMLPHVLAYPVRTRFLILMVQSANQAGYSVQLPGIPTGAATVRHYFSPTSGAFSNSGGLTFNEVFVAAAMRLYGVDITADPGGANFVTTDFAIQKVTYYGTQDQTYDGPNVMLTVDFGGDIPGFVGRDSSSRNSRAVVSATPPRLSWRKVITGDMTPVINYNTGVNRSPLADNSGVAFPTQFVSVQNWPIGVLDVTVLVRRSVISNASSSLGTRAADTSFSSEEI